MSDRQPKWPDTVGTRRGFCCASSSGLPPATAGIPDTERLLAGRAPSRCSLVPKRATCLAGEQQPSRSCGPRHAVAWSTTCPLASARPLHGRRQSTWDASVVVCRHPQGREPCSTNGGGQAELSLVRAAIPQIPTWVRSRVPVRRGADVPPGLRPCLPRCPTLVPAGRKRCPAHASPTWTSTQGQGCLRLVAEASLLAKPKLFHD